VWDYTSILPLHLNGVALSYAQGQYVLLLSTAYDSDTTDLSDVKDVDIRQLNTF